MSSTFFYPYACWLGVATRFCYFSYSCNKITNDGNLRREGFPKAHSLKEHATKVRNAYPHKHVSGDQVVSAVRKQKVPPVLSSLFFFIESWTPEHDMVLTTFKIGLLSYTSLESHLQTYWQVHLLGVPFGVLLGSIWLGGYKPPHSLYHGMPAARD